MKLTINSWVVIIVIVECYVTLPANCGILPRHITWGSHQIHVANPRWTILSERNPLRPHEVHGIPESNQNGSSPAFLNSETAAKQKTNQADLLGNGQTQKWSVSLESNSLGSSVNPGWFIPERKPVVYGISDQPTSYWSQTDQLQKPAFVATSNSDINEKYSDEQLFKDMQQNSNYDSPGTVSESEQIKRTSSAMLGNQKWLVPLQMGSAESLANPADPGWIIPEEKPVVYGFSDQPTYYWTQTDQLPKPIIADAFNSFTNESFSEEQLLEGTQHNSNYGSTVSVSKSKPQKYASSSMLMAMIPPTNNHIAHNTDINQNDKYEDGDQAGQNWWLRPLAEKEPQHLLEPTFQQEGDREYLFAAGSVQKQDAVAGEAVQMIENRDDATTSASSDSTKLTKEELELVAWNGLITVVVVWGIMLTITIILLDLYAQAAMARSLDNSIFESSEAWSQPAVVMYQSLLNEVGLKFDFGDPECRKHLVCELHLQRSSLGKIPCGVLSTLDYLLDVILSMKPSKNETTIELLQKYDEAALARAKLKSCPNFGSCD